MYFCLLLQIWLVRQGHVLIQACAPSKVLTSQLYLYSTKSLDNVNSDHADCSNN